MTTLNGRPVIHLDTKDWIELARGHYGKAPEFQEIAQIVLEKSKSGQAIFPLSVIHFIETVKNANPERRQRLAKFVTIVSQGWTILPAPEILDLEIENVYLKWQGRPERDLHTVALRKGVSHMMGAKGTLLDKDPKHPMPEEEKNRILEQLDGPWGLHKLLDIGFPESETKRIEEELKETAERLEKGRQSWQTMKDTERRRTLMMADYLANEIGPKLMPVISRHPLPLTFMIDTTSSREKIVEFFQSIPTCYCNAQLTTYQNDMQRRIQPNDLHDILSLSIAIPYSNVVVTERMWQSAIIQTKLDKLYGTVVLKSTKQLAPILGSK